MLDLYQFNDFIYLQVVITEDESCDRYPEPANPQQLLENWEEYWETNRYH